jgi:cytochrome P450
MREIETALDIAGAVRDAPEVEITDWADASYVLKSTAFAPIRPESGHGGQWHTLLVGDSVVDLHGDEHFARRRLLSGLFRKAALLQEYEQQYLVPSIERLLARLRESGGPARIDLVSEIRRIMVALLTRLAGLDGIDVDDEGYAEFEPILLAVERGARSKFVSDQENVVRTALQAQTRLVDEYFAPAWERRAEIIGRVAAGELPETAIPTDLISLMVRHEEHYRAFGEDAAYREASLLLIASIGSTTNAVCFAVWDLHNWLREHPEDLSKTRDRAFLQRCFAESLRLRQTNSLLRTAVEDTTLPSGAEVRAGEVAIVLRPDVNALLADGGSSSLGPEAFDPYRTLGDNHTQYGLAFGGGAHTCIGKSFTVGGYPRPGSQDADELGIGVRVFATLLEHGAQLVDDDPPQLAEDIPGRPTWKRLPVELVDL